MDNQLIVCFVYAAHKELMLKPRRTPLEGLKRKGGGLRPKPEPSAQGADG
jgi:hypothetical protein